MSKSTIPLTPCDSSQIAAAGFDPATNTLALQFKNASGTGSVYEYRNVTPEFYAEFCQAKSKGRFFGQRIKDAKNADGIALHPHTKMVPDEEEAA